MGENSRIAWTTHTFNPWVGCQRVSPGCTNCYAEAYDKRVGGRPKNQRMNPNVPELRWGPNAPRVRTSLANWRKPLAWDKDSAVSASNGKGRHRVFCSSLADVFEDRADLVEHRRDLFRLIAKTPHLDWLLLTKRPENIARLMPAADSFMPRAPWPNVWLGTTVEDQQRANERIPELLKVPAVVRFLSVEPLLEAVQLNLPPTRALKTDPAHQFGFTIKPTDTQRFEGAIDWVIIGGESGPGARPFHTEWARSLVEQARAVGAAPFVKQLGENAVASGRDQLALLKMTDHGDIDQFPEDLRVRFDPVTF